MIVIDIVTRHYALSAETWRDPTRASASEGALGPTDLAIGTIDKACGQPHFARFCRLKELPMETASSL
ncbi:hypothetical protein ACFQX9_07790 [Bradyrhizobium sp. GCM10028915]|uniref:hypothetical protein n=1 Tax=Bradyrhizobium sp. GCM10028915 TaxID=3273385 RepID=UPI00361BAF3C